MAIRLPDSRFSQWGNEFSKCGNLLNCYTIIFHDFYVTLREVVKKIFHITSLILLISIILSSTGLPLFIHICHADNHHTVSAFPIDDNCCEKGGQCDKNGDCCDNSVEYVKPDVQHFFSTTAKKDFPSPQPVILPKFNFHIPLFKPLIPDFRTAVGHNHLCDIPILTGCLLL